jgi:recombination protein RecT
MENETTTPAQTPATTQAAPAPATKQPQNTLRGLIESDAFKAQLALALPKHLTVDRMVRIAVTATLKAPDLLNCSQASFVNALLTCSQLGLEPDGRLAHLIPYNYKAGMVVQLIIDYKGKVQLAMQSGLVSNIHADKVCENDIFTADRGMVTAHIVDYRRPRGEAFAYYCIIRLKDGSEKSEVMPLNEVEDVRKRSRAGSSSPWVTDFHEMAKKTVFHRASKWIQLSPEIRDALDADDDRPDPVSRARNITPLGDPFPGLNGGEVAK